MRPGVPCQPKPYAIASTAAALGRIPSPTKSASIAAAASAYERSAVRFAAAIGLSTSQRSGA